MRGREFKIDLREDGRGGGRRDELLVSMNAQSPRQRFVLLVHGFNTDREAATARYEEFTASVLNLAQTLSGSIGFVLWPGDGRGLSALLSYPERARTACECAADLAEYLSSCKAPNGAIPEIVLVAHSLGARVVIEALERLSTLSPERLSAVKIVLMAAAYPVETAMLPPTSRIVRETSSLVLFSHADGVLRDLFPLAERAAGLKPGGEFEAVGLYGAPPFDLWTHRTLMSQNKSGKALGHNDYWQSNRVHSLICRFLGFPVAISLDEREIMAVPIKTRPGVAARQTPSRDLPN